MKNRKVRKGSIRKIVGAVLIIAGAVLSGNYLLHADTVTKVSELGDVAHYNGVVFSNYESENADVEGALAVGSRIRSTKAHFGSGGYFDIGASWHWKNSSQIGNYENDEKYPTLLLSNKNVRLGSKAGQSWSFNVTGPQPMMVMGNSTLEVYRTLQTQFNGGLQNGTNSSVVSAADDLANQWFEDAYVLTTRLGNQYEDAGGRTAAGEISWADYAKINNSTDAAPYVNTTLKYKGEVDNELLVINVRTDSTLQLGNAASNRLHVPYSWLNSYEAIVFCFPDVVNVTGQSMVPAIDGMTIQNWNGTYTSMPKAQFEARLDMGEKVVWSFPNASTIDLGSYSHVVGSIIAPDAYVVGSGGSINGQLVADSFDQTGHMELHALRISRRVYDVVEDKDPEPELPLSIWKYNEAGTQTLGGAKFIIVSRENEKDLFFDGVAFVEDIEEAKVYEGNSNGRVETDPLPYGTYYVREVEAPPGYVLNTTDPGNKETYHEYEVEVSDEAKGALDLIYVRRRNEPKTTRITFKKVGKDTDEALAGAVFVLC